MRLLLVALIILTQLKAHESSDPIECSAFSSDSCAKDEWVLQRCREGANELHVGTKPIPPAWWLPHRVVTLGSTQALPLRAPPRDARLAVQKGLADLKKDLHSE